MAKEKSIHKLLSFVLFLVALSFSAACSSTPSESEGKKFLDDQGARNKLYTVKSFTKTNGIEDERTYKMEFQADLECLQPGAMIISAGITMGTNAAIACERKGQVWDVKGKLVFEKTENGWRVQPF